MKKIIKKIQQLGLYSLLLAGLSACNKNADVSKAINIQIKGFNVSSSPLEISIDTVVYRDFKVAANTEVDFSKVFVYPSATNEVSLSIKDANSGKEVFQQQVTLNTSEIERFYQFVLLNGKQLELKPPAADPATNKIGFYIHYPASNDPIDVYMQNNEGQIVYLAKNITPSTWVYADYNGHEGFNNPNANYDIYFTKAGTTDVWAFNDDQYMSKSSEDSWLIPQNGVKGRVCSYFITPGTVDLRAVRLFSVPK
ncbi:MAG: hypothetical protein ACTHMC_01990 [Pseudobacter sp.]|uniref:hypothetical protein n=1 Tax=Pseudobacter sp. TaxID=2045420 RepID=UPI003F81AD86